LVRAAEREKKKGGKPEFLRREKERKPKARPVGDRCGWGPVRPPHKKKEPVK